METDICVGCTKFSHAVGVREDNSIPWTHLSAPDLCLLVRSNAASVAEGELIMQVVQGNASLETIDVGTLVDRALLARQRTQQAGIMPQIEQLPIFGINKDALLALRYRMEDQQDRRLQFRLQSMADCDLIVDLFKRRGMEFQQQRPRTGRPGTGRPGTASSEVRPATTESSSSYFPVANAPPKRSPFQTQTLEAGDLSRPISTVVAKPQTSQDMAPPPFFNRAVALSTQASTVPPPPAFQLHRTSTTPSQELDYQLSSMSRRTSHVSKETPQEPAHPRSTTSICGNSEIQDQTQPRTMTAIQVPSVTQTPGLPCQPSSDGAQVTERPASRAVPAITPFLADTLDHEIPPRREMPFKRPGSQQTNSSRPSTAAQLTPKSKIGQADLSSPVRQSPKSSAKSATALRPSTASPLKRTFNPYAETIESARPATSAAPQQDAQWSKQRSSVQSSVTIARTISPTGPSRRPSNVGELIRSHKPLSESSPSGHKIRRLDSQADAPHEIDTPPRTSSPKDKENERLLSAASPTSHKAPRLDPTINAVAAVQRGRYDEPSLHEYASQSVQDRQAILDEFMISKLEDRDFTILCEDVDSCWRRIALGL